MDVKSVHCILVCLGTPGREPPPQVHLRRERLEALGRWQKRRARETTSNGRRI